MYYNRNGEEINIDEFFRLIETTNYKIVANDTVKGFYISTVWLGLDHSFGDGTTTAPIIFETMIFKEGDWKDLWCKRYTNEADALSTHSSVVSIIGSGFRIEELNTFLLLKPKSLN